jgi:lysylphosphatidylglycerol synthetase-like protein (DUF2156 family)
VTPLPAGVDPEALAEALRHHGRTAFAFDVLQAPERYGFFQSRTVPGAIVPYRSVGRGDVVIGEPLAPADALERVTREFLEDRADRGRRVLGFVASEDFARAAIACGASAAQLTSEPEIDPVTWEPAGGSAKKMRQYVKRLRKEGYEGRALPARSAVIRDEFRRGAEALIRTWIREGVGRSAHILEVDAWRLPAEKRYFAVYDPKDEERLLALLIAHPVYALDGWHLCHLVRDPKAPKGVAELVVSRAIETLGDEGCRYATFGPFPEPQMGEFLGVGRTMERIVRRAYDLAGRRGGYARSVEFYRKVQAGTWRRRYMVFFPRKVVLRNFLTLVRMTHVLGFLDRG